MCEYPSLLSAQSTSLAQMIEMSPAKMPGMGFQGEPPESSTGADYTDIAEVWRHLGQFSQKLKNRQHDIDLR